MATKREVLACLEQSQLARIFAGPRPREPCRASRRNCTRTWPRRSSGCCSASNADKACPRRSAARRHDQRRPRRRVGRRDGPRKDGDSRALVLAAPEDDPTTSRNDARRLARRGARLPATTLMEKPLADPPRRRRGRRPRGVRLRRRRLRRRGLRVLRRRRPQGLRGRRELRLPRFKGSSIGKRPRAVARDFSGMSGGHRGAVERGISETCAFVNGGGVPRRPGVAEGRARRAPSGGRAADAQLRPGFAIWETAYAASTVQCYAKLMTF